MRGSGVEQQSLGGTIPAPQAFPLFLAKPRKRRMPRLAVMAMLFVTPFFVASASAAPEPKRGNADLKKYCTGDALKFCGDIDPDSKEMDACFKKNRAELSENCRRAITAYEASGNK